jgi:hypothetical protein
MLYHDCLSRLSWRGGHAVVVCHCSLFSWNFLGLLSRLSCYGFPDLAVMSCLAGHGYPVLDLLTVSDIFTRLPCHTGAAVLAVILSQPCHCYINPPFCTDVTVMAGLSWPSGHGFLVMAILSRLSYSCCLVIRLSWLAVLSCMPCHDFPVSTVLTVLIHWLSCCACAVIVIKS